jgi:hypothetical protein
LELKVLVSHLVLLQLLSPVYTYLPWVCHFPVPLATLLRCRVPGPWVHNRSCAVLKHVFSDVLYLSTSGVHIEDGVHVIWNVNGLHKVWNLWTHNWAALSKNYRLWHLDFNTQCKGKQPSEGYVLKSHIKHLFMT